MPDFGIPALSDELFKKLTDLLFKESGITLKEHKKYLLINRLSKYVGVDKAFRSFELYYEALLADRTGDLLVQFVNVLTTNFSFFFREEIHFQFLQKYLRDHLPNDPYIRLWSAACSTGEETYSMAITCRQALGHSNKSDIKILGTDISTRVLEIAQAGSYHYSKIRGHIEDNELKSFFELDKDKKNFVVRDEVKELIAYRYLNLFDPYPFQKLFDIVFLRNVLIYFDNQEKETVINKIYHYIKPGGYLILGLSESLVGVSHPFESIKNSIYHKK